MADEKWRTVEVVRANISAPRPCRGCGVSIVFAIRVPSATRKPTPFRAPLEVIEIHDDTLVIIDSNHFIDCPAAKRFKK